MKVWKMLAGAGIAATAAELGISYYFFNRTMVRQNAKTERTKEMSGTNWDQYMPKIGVWKEWMLEQPHEDVYITAGDGLKLHGTYFPATNAEEESPKLAICFHGYTSNGISGFIGLSNYYLKKGYAMLLVDQRAHGESDGKYIGFGCLDRKDALRWIQYAEERLGSDCSIVLHGTSMGGATVLMTSGLSLPGSVKAIISDCAFTSAWDVFAHVLEDQYHLPARPVLEISTRMVQKYAGYDLRECNSAKEVRKSTVPILMIHGDADSFVPCRMCHEIYRNCVSDKDLLIVHGAGHCESHYKDTEAYEAKLTEFLTQRNLL